MIQLSASRFKRASLAIDCDGHLIVSHVGDASRWRLPVDHAEGEPTVRSLVGQL
jgi:hypothetical protein